MKNNNIMRKNKFMTFFKGMQKMQKLRISKKNAKVEDFFDRKNLRKLTDILLGNHPNHVKFTLLNLIVANLHPEFTEHIRT